MDLEHGRLGMDNLKRLKVHHAQKQLITTTTGMVFGRVRFSRRDVSDPSISEDQGSP